MARLLIGTSGWSYKEWKGGFYAGVPQRRWLEHYAATFDTAELNATFYRGAKPAMIRHLLEATPPSFRFAAKGHRISTHMKRLADPLVHIERQRGLLAPLGERLAAVVWQLPARLTIDLERLGGFTRALAAWPEVRHGIEFRDASWFEPAVAELLSAGRIANVMSDAPAWPLWDLVTTDLVYVRLHGHDRLYRSPYSETELAGWARRCVGWLEEGRSVFVYFDNTDEGAAPADALRLRRLVGGEAGVGVDQGSEIGQDRPSSTLRDVTR